MKARVRPVREEDLDDLLRLASRTGFGLTTLPPERDHLERRIHESVHAFRQRVEQPAGQSYLFVLEQGGHIVGTSGIVSKAGGFEPFYTYRLKTEHLESETLGVERDVQCLELVAEHNGPGEIGSLFLDPECQGKGLGGLLSRSRFLFIAQHPGFFEEIIVAEMRGVVDESGRSPFWEAIGKHFFGVDFPKADYLSVKSKTFIAELMPKAPIYVTLLPEEAQAVIGQVHPKTRPALEMLKHEGFEHTRLVDIFEAGPLVRCRRDEIRTVAESKESKLAEVGETVGDDGERCLVSNARIDFRACASQAVELPGGGIRLDEETAAALEVAPGDAVRYVLKQKR